MKNIETIVTDLETSKKMHEAGIDFGETVFKWSLFRGDWKVVSHFNFLTNTEKVIPAPTTDEIIDRLPDEIEGHSFLLLKDNGIYDTGYGDTVFFHCESDKLPQQALAKLMMWCKKEGYL